MEDQVLDEDTVRQLCSVVTQFARKPVFMMPGQEVITVCVPPGSRELLSDLIAKCYQEMEPEKP